MCNFNVYGKQNVHYISIHVCVLGREENLVYHLYFSRGVKVRERTLILEEW